MLEGCAAPVIHLETWVAASMGTYWPSTSTYSCGPARHHNEPGPLCIQAGQGADLRFCGWCVPLPPFATKAALQHRRACPRSYPGSTSPGIVPHDRAAHTGASGLPTPRVLAFPRHLTESDDVVAAVHGDTFVSHDGTDIAVCNFQWHKWPMRRALMTTVNGVLVPCNFQLGIGTGFEVTEFWSIKGLHTYTLSVHLLLVCV